MQESDIDNTTPLYIKDLCEGSPQLDIEEQGEGDKHSPSPPPV
jgi:hypothetical protein